MAKYKSIIGRAENIHFPARELSNIPAKVDTGAYLSAIHATAIEEVTKKSGKKVLSFRLLEGHPASDTSKKIQVTGYTKTKIQNSFGHSQERYVVKFKVSIGGKTFITEFTLADRSMKVFPVLLGRKLLSRRFLVDTELAHIERSILKTKMKDWLIKDNKADDGESV